jgi:hypothetical protein
MHSGQREHEFRHLLPHLCTAAGQQSESNGLGSFPPTRAFSPFRRIRKSGQSGIPQRGTSHGLCQR